MPLRTKRWLCIGAVVTLLTCTLATPVAHAQTDDAATRATARSLFEEGVAFSEAGKWGEAADKFQRSLSLRHSQVVAFNLATALMELGRLVEASELLEGVRRDASTTTVMKRRVDTLLDSIRPQLAWITVQLHDPEHRVAVLDGHALPVAALGIPRAVDPGKRSLEVRVDGRVVWTRTITVSAGQSEETTIDLPVEQPTPTTPTTTRAPTPTETAALAQPTSTTTAPIETNPAETESSGTWLWVSIGGAAIAVGVLVAVIALSSGGSEPAAPYMGSLGDGVIEVPAQ